MVNQRVIHMKSFVTCGVTMRVILLSCLSVLLALCALLKSPPPPRDTFEISAPTSFGRVGRTRAQILVKTPTSLKSVDSDRMILRPTGSSVTYLEGAQWSDTVPRMIQAKLVESFENSRATGATAKPGDGLVIDYQLVSDIRRFDIIPGTNGRVLVEISIKLLADRSGKVRETRIFRSTTPTRGDDAEAYVAAFDVAFDKLAKDVIVWVTRRI